MRIVIFFLAFLLGIESHAQLFRQVMGPTQFSSVLSGTTSNTWLKNGALTTNLVLNLPYIPSGLAITNIVGGAGAGAGTFLRADGTWTTPAGGASLDAITADVASSAIANGNFTNQWSWALTANNRSALTLRESAASTGGTDNQYILRLMTKGTSTASPLGVWQQDTNVFFVAGDAPQIRMNDNVVDVTRPQYGFYNGYNMGMGADGSTVYISINGAKRTYVDSFGYKVSADGTRLNPAYATATISGSGMYFSTALNGQTTEFSAGATNFFGGDKRGPVWRSNNPDVNGSLPPSDSSADFSIAGFTNSGFSFGTVSPIRHLFTHINSNTFVRVSGNTNPANGEIKMVVDGVTVFDSTSLATTIPLFSAGPSAPVGTVVNTGTPAANAIPIYSDTTGTNVAPSKISITDSTNLNVGSLIATNITASKAVVVDSTKQLTNSVTTATELGYLSGVTTPTGTGALVLATTPTLVTPNVNGSITMTTSNNIIYQLLTPVNTTTNFIVDFGNSDFTFTSTIATNIALIYSTNRVTTATNTVVTSLRMFADGANITVATNHPSWKLAGALTMPITITNGDFGIFTFQDYTSAETGVVMSYNFAH